MSVEQSQATLRWTHTTLECSLTGAALLDSPYFNKGTAFTEREREEFGLVGLLPSQICSLREQADRAYQQYLTHRTALDRNIFMTSMKEQNIVLFYRLLQDHLKEMFSIIYTPTEGDAIAGYSRIFRRSGGCFLDIAHPDNIKSALMHWKPEDIDIIVCSDGEQILGIGDQGVGAILISAAKLVLYTACAGIHPNRTLPVVLDVGTDNKLLLEDNLYLGLRRSRAKEQEYDGFIRRFLSECSQHLPNAYIHFEDFGITNARRILDEYSDSFACFNDDIQGTGCVALAAIYAALRALDNVLMQDIRVVIFGAGTAGIGIADQIRDAIAVEGNKPKEQACAQIWCVDKSGLLLANSSDLSKAQRPYAKSGRQITEPCDCLLDVVKYVKPHVLIGTSTTPKAFTKDIVTEMAIHVDRPIIFPLSNPTRLHEAEPRDLINWTAGRALVATGSPFPPVEYDGQTREIAECNNSEIFPGIGLGVVLSRSRLVTPGILVAATKALASQAPIILYHDMNAALLPDVSDVREISVQIAAAVMRHAQKEGLARDSFPLNAPELEQWIQMRMWEASYKDLAMTCTMEPMDFNTA